MKTNFLRKITGVSVMIFTLALFALVVISPFKLGSPKSTMLHSGSQGTAIQEEATPTNQRRNGSAMPPTYPNTAFLSRTYPQRIEPIANSNWYSMREREVTFLDQRNFLIAITEHLYQDDVEYGLEIWVRMVRNGYYYEWLGKSKTGINVTAGTPSRSVMFFIDPDLSKSWVSMFGLDGWMKEIYDDDVVQHRLYSVEVEVPYDHLVERMNSGVYKVISTDVVNGHRALVIEINPTMVAHDPSIPTWRYWIGADNGIKYKAKAIDTNDETVLSWGEPRELYIGDEAAARAVWPEIITHPATKQLSARRIASTDYTSVPKATDVIDRLAYGMGATVRHTFAITGNIYAYSLPEARTFDEQMRTDERDKFVASQPIREATLNVLVHPDGTETYALVANDGEALPFVFNLWPTDASTSDQLTAQGWNKSDSYYQVTTQGLAEPQTWITGYPEAFTWVDSETNKRVMLLATSGKKDVVANGIAAATTGAETD